ncbi:hypothetical protein ACJIZ3_002094 [Penstemon smallii]|uniref:SPT2 chromatin protein n=1 Tax=Penstemon smallii TaxID=265156 RepID=A0ABD3U6Z0_9LAMI
MRGYGRDEYEDLDEYEEDGEEEEEDGYEEEEVHQPTQEELEYLELRQKLKDSIRKQMKKELGTANSGSRDKMNVLRKDNYGSFFGPSQPVIAQRVIQESKSLLENPNLAARISKPNHTNNKNSVSAPIGSKQRANPPKVTNVLKRKVEMIKNTRDYSFLLSEDAELPASMKSPPPRNVSAPKSEARSAQQLPRNKQVVNDRGRAVLNDRDERKKVLTSSQSRPKVGLEMMAPASKLSMESRKQLGSNNASGPGRPVGPKGGISSRTATEKKVAQPIHQNAMAGARKPTPSQPQPGVRKPTSSRLQSDAHRTPPSHSQSSLSKNTSVQRKAYQETSKPKVNSRQSVPFSRDEVMRLPPKNSAAARGMSADQRPKAKPGKRPHGDSDDELEAFKMLRQMTGKFHRRQYQDDDDISDMEASFHEIEREEKRSAKIARLEDEEEARLLEEEERRKKMRLAKKRKMSY